MTERWEQKLREVNVQTPPDMWRRIQEGPSNEPLVDLPSRRQRVVAGLVALAVFTAAGVLVWRAFDRSTVGPGIPTTSSVLRSYKDPSGWTAAYPSDWRVIRLGSTSDGIGTGVTF